jgi:hypothetical protein
MLPPAPTQSGGGLILALHPTVHWGSMGHCSETTNLRVADVEDRMLKAQTERQGMSLSDVIR